MEDSTRWYSINLLVGLFTELETLAINDALLLKAAWRDVNAKLKSFWGFKSELPFHFDSPWGAIDDGTEY